MKFRKWRVTSAQVGVLLAAVVLLTIGGIIATVSYFTVTIDRDELDRIRDENGELRTMNQTFEDNIRELDAQLTDYQDRIHKLAIVAGLAELSPSGESGIGGLAPSEESGDLDAIRDRLDGLGDAVDVLQGAFDERNALIASLPAIAPVRGIFTSGFGYRRDPFTTRRAFHSGLDIVAAPGTEVHASGDGIVTRAGVIGSLGNAVYISHGSGITTRYGHLSKVTATAGQRVKRGDVIGHLGNSGRSTGHHLHYEVRLNGSPTDPLGYILDAGR